RDGRGFVSRFPDLIGIERIEPPRRLEIMPYATSRAAFTRQPAGNPFNDGSKLDPGLGADAKIGLGSNLTLNATVNPDFGQVEVDPAVVNLSDRETFFNEKRPFFVEGASIFQFGFGGQSNFWGFNWSGPNFFYSRRVGRSLSVPGAPDKGYVDGPDGAHIRSEEHTSELQSRSDLVCRLLLEKKKILLFHIILQLSLNPQSQNLHQ